MKNLILLALAALTLSSCSGDDTNSASGLKKIKKTEYNPGGAVSRVLYHKYKDGQLYETAFYDANNFFIKEIKFDYYADGLLMNEPGMTYIYDNEKRMIHSKYTGGQLVSEMYYTNYTFNGNNTISAVRQGLSPSTKTYYLNENNLIYKEVSDSPTCELTFEGNNAVSATVGQFISTYDYDMEHDPSLLQVVNPFGDYRSNPVLADNSILGNETATADRYLIKKTEGGTVTEYKYTFNGSGLPTTMSEYVNGVLVNTSEYLY